MATPQNKIAPSPLLLSDLKRYAKEAMLKKQSFLEAILDRAALTNYQRERAAKQCNGIILALEEVNKADDYEVELPWDVEEELVILVAGDKKIIALNSKMEIARIYLIK